MQFIPKISNHEIERKFNCRFLGVIINETLTWKEHILAAKAKMRRYVSISYELKTFLPLSVRKKTYFTVLFNPT